MYYQFKSSREGSALAGWMFESIANKQLASGISGLDLFAMAKSRTNDSPILSISRMLTRLQPQTSLPTAKTERTGDDDSETVYIDLWVFQHAIILHSHKGSDPGYPLIRKIIRGLENPFRDGANRAKRKKSSIRTFVHYVLVVPKDDENVFWEWIMPASYSTETKFQDHRGRFLLPSTTLDATVIGSHRDQALSCHVFAYIVFISQCVDHPPEIYE
ncbi:hypothetical protein K435DRAFT_851383 [Dendrothele bispora CBS 962.96]|uniref:Uncharacterized protein n=1 Tax=Dendrothele bispora (strain CBS 962.96) TaxID=1314807 RepID=A0A4S8MNZ6_DENBC|nr:hypothetical protein K435DRAFT_851383 [Dendrothele bispora CBS 962.96]